jgi:hypothetical protein
MKNSALTQNNFDIPVVHKLRILYAYIYTIGNKLPKRDKLGLNKEIEKELFKILCLLISASLEASTEKINSLKKARIKIETLKQIIRLEYELKIITEKIYIKIQQSLQEISKMVNGWLKYTETQIPLK